MAEKRRKGDKDEPTLELPPLFRRRRRRAEEPPTEPEPELAAPEPGEAGATVAEMPTPTHEPEPVLTQPEPEPLPTQPEPVSTQPEPEPAGQRKASRRADRRAARRAARTGPLLPARLAAALTGLVVGAAGTGLTYAGLLGCEALRGTDSCGGSGVFLLLAIVVLMVLGGTVMLKALGMKDPGGISFLAVGVTCVVVLVTLMEELFSPWMFLAVPLISCAGYVLASWVTTRFVETQETGPGVDVR